MDQKKKEKPDEEIREYDEHDYRRGLGPDYDSKHPPVSPADKSRPNADQAEDQEESYEDRNGR